MFRRYFYEFVELNICATCVYCYYCEQWKEFQYVIIKARSSSIESEVDKQFFIGYSYSISHDELTAQYCSGGTSLRYISR